jgi:hypothetical protein
MGAANMTFQAAISLCPDGPDGTRGNNVLSRMLIAGKSNQLIPTTKAAAYLLGHSDASLSLPIQIIDPNIGSTLAYKWISMTNTSSSLTADPTTDITSSDPDAPRFLAILHTKEGINHSK